MNRVAIVNSTITMDHHQSESSTHSSEGEDNHSNNHSDDAANTLRQNRKRALERKRQRRLSATAAGTGINASKKQKGTDGPVLDALVDDKEEEDPEQSSKDGVEFEAEDSPVEETSDVMVDDYDVDLDAANESTPKKSNYRNNNNQFSGSGDSDSSSNMKNNHHHQQQQQQNSSNKTPPLPPGWATDTPEYQAGVDALQYTLRVLGISASNRRSLANYGLETIDDLALSKAVLAAAKCDTLDIHSQQQLAKICYWMENFDRRYNKAKNPFQYMSAACLEREFYETGKIPRGFKSSPQKRVVTPVQQQGEPEEGEQQHNNNRREQEDEDEEEEEQQKRMPKSTRRSSPAKNPNVAAMPARDASPPAAATVPRRRRRMHKNRRRSSAGH